MSQPSLAVWAIIGAFGWLSPGFGAEPAPTIRAADRGAPHLYLRDGKRVITTYTGSTLARSFRGSHPQPLALASADFDEDGTPDLISGYATQDGAGAFSLHRGNADALWPYGAALRDGEPPAFLPDARVFAIPEAPNFLATGDFDADGHWDVVAGRQGGKALYLLRGDGQGGFADPQRIDLPGTLTAFTSGEINRPDGLTDLAVGIMTPDGPQVLVFESPAGALRGEPEVFPMPAPVSALAMMPLDDDRFTDLAVGAGNQLVAIHGRDRMLSRPKAQRDRAGAAEVTRQTLAFAVRSLSVGRFTSTLLDLAALGDDGKVHFLERADADYQAAVANLPVAMKGRNGLPGPISNSAAQSGHALPDKPSVRALVMRHEVTLPGLQESVARLVTARTSTTGTDDAIVLDGNARQLHVLSRQLGTRAMHLATSLDSSTGAPAALLPMRLHPSALHGLVALQQSQPEPLVLLPRIQNTFVVTNTLDSGPGQFNSQSTATPGSLRTAITNAINASGTSEITFNIPYTDPNYNAVTHSFVITPLPINNCGTFGSFTVPCQGLPPLPPGCIIDGYTQPSGTVNSVFQAAASPNTLVSGDNAVIRITISGALASQGADGIWLFNGTGTVRGLNVIGFQPIDINQGLNTTGGFGVNADSGNNVVEGNFLGTDATGTTVSPNYLGTGGFGGPNVIGGTTPQARNILSGNSYANFGSAVDSAPNSYFFQGNYVGTDHTGTIGLGTAGYVNDGVAMVVGGTAAGAGNLLSGNSVGISMNFPPGNPFTPDSNVIQGNLIGTDVTGRVAVPNTTGIEMETGQLNLFGGTTPAARNVISGNFGDGLQIDNAAQQTTVQGNFIGLDITGATALGNAANGIDHTMLGGAANAVGSLIGGESPGAGNVISGNSQAGLIFGGAVQIGNFSGSTVAGNLIGTDPSGNVALGNGLQGILIIQGGSAIVIGGADTPARNVIAFNGAEGVRIDGSDQLSFGFPVGGSNQVIGNSIFSNGAAGVRVASGTQDLVSQNSIYSNSGLGIDIDALGHLVNSSSCPQATNGANKLQNAPVLTAAPGGTTLVTATATDPNGNTSEFSNCAAMASSSGTLNISGSLNSTAATFYTIEFFSNASCDPSTFGQGKTFLSRLTVHTDDQCNANFGPGLDTTKADLSVTLDFDHNLFSSTVTPGQAFTYRALVTNNGPGPASSVSLTDTLPSSVALGTVTTSQGSCNSVGNAVTCSLGTMASGATALVTMSMTVGSNSVGTISDTVNVSASTTDPTSLNNMATLNLSSVYQFAAIDHFVPASAVAGSGAVPLVIDGFTFYPNITTVTANNTPLTPVTVLSNQTCGSFFSQTTCQGLGVTLPAALTAAPGRITITLNNPIPGGGGSSQDFTVYPNPGTVTGFQITGIPNPAVQNTGYNMTVTAVDANGHVVPGYRGIVNLTGQFIGSPTFSPASPYQFTAADSGVHAFSTTFVSAGADTITVTDAGTPSVTGSLNVNVNALLGPPARLVPGTGPDPVPIGFPFTTPLGVTVEDASFNLLPGITLTYTVVPANNGAGGTFSNGQGTIQVVTDANGNAAPILTANQIAGQFQVNVTVDKLEVQFFPTSTSSVPAHITIVDGNPQSTPIFTQFGALLDVMVADAQNKPIPNVTVTFSAPSTGASVHLASTSAVTAQFAQGLVTVGEARLDPIGIANGIAGSYQVTASAGSLSVPFSFTNTPTPSVVTQFSTSGTPQSTLLNTQFGNPLVVKPLDANGNCIGNVQVSFSAPSSGASAGLSSSNVTSDPITCLAQVTATANGTKGTYNVTATVGAVSTTFALTNLAGTNNSLTASSGTPQSTPVNSGFALPLRVTLLDPNGNPISGQTITFAAPAGAGSASATLSNATAKTDTNGNAQITATANGVLGSYTVVATLNTLSAIFTLTNAAAGVGTVTATGGTPQSQTVGVAFGTALQVTVNDTNGSPMNGVTVNFSAPATGATAGLANGGVATTNAQGVASIVATAGTIAGSYQVTASVGGLNATFSLTNTPGPPFSVTATGGTPQSAITSLPFTTALQATVKDSNGNLLQGVTVTFTDPNTGASAGLSNNGVATTNAQGVASVTATANASLGSYSVTASVGSLTATFSLTNIVGPPASITATGGTPQSAQISTQFATALQATVKDSQGNLLSGVSVTFSAPQTGASATLPSNGVVTTNAQGVASITATANATTGGPYSVTATVGQLSATFSLTNTAVPPPSISATGGTPQSTTVGQAFGTALQVLFKDNAGNPKSGVTITFSAPATGATATLSNGGTAVTDDTGSASVTATAGSLPGNYNVTASAQGVSTSFSLTNVVGPPFTLTPAGTPQSATVTTAFASTLQVTVKDSQGNLLNGITVTFAAPGTGASASLSNGGVATTNAQGVASVTATANTIPGPYSVTASANSITATFNLTNNAGPPASITAAGTPQSTQVGMAFGTTLQATVKDSQGNLLSGVTVTFTAPTTGASATLPNGGVAVTNASGVASITATANGTAGSYTVHAAAGSLSASYSLTNNPGLPATVTATGGTPQAAQINAGFPSALQATVQDSFGNLLSGVTVNFSAPVSGASAGLAPASATTNSSGVASVNATANGTAGSYNVTASVAGVPGSASFALTNVVATVSVQTSPAGLPFTVDGTTYTTAQSFPFLPGTIHTISVHSTIPVSSGSQQAFTGWSDNKSAGHTITATATLTTYTANFQLQYLLTTSASPSGAGAVTPGTGFFSAGSTVPVQASLGSGASFVGWSGPVVSPSSPSTSVVMTGPVSIVANYSAAGTSVSPSSLALQYYLGTDPATAAGQLTPDSGLRASYTVNATGPNANLIVLSSLGGVAGSTITVTPVSTAQPGSYTIPLNFHFSDGSNITVLVGLQVYPLPSFRSLPTTSLSFTAQSGSTTPQTQQESLAAFTRNFSFTLSVTYLGTQGSQLALSTRGPRGAAVPQDPPWLKLSATGGTTPMTFNVTADPTGLSAGTHTANIVATASGASNSPFVVPVTFTITAPPPSISISSIVNAASMATGAAAPNDILSAMGTFPGCGSAQVTVDGASTTVFYSSATQINFLMPGRVAPEKSATVQIGCNGLSSQATPVTIGGASPGLFTASQNGKGQAAIVNQDGSLSTSTPAGTWVQVYGTGFGSYNPADSDGLTRLASTVTVTIAGIPATVRFAGQAPGYTSGLQQIDVLVPLGTPAGAQPLVLQIGNAQSQAGVTLTILPATQAIAR